MLTASDPLPFSPRRVLVAGVAGSGKTTLAARVSRMLDLPRYELDALHHGPDWTARPTFLSEVCAFAATERWVSEWRYKSKGIDDVLPPRAQLCLWLDYPDRVVRTRLWRRTLGRSILRRELWNGNREPTLWRLAVTTAPEDNVLRWQQKTLDVWRDRMPAYEASLPNLTIVRFGHPREVERWLAQLAESGVSTAPPKRRSRSR